MANKKSNNKRNIIIVIAFILILVILYFINHTSENTQKNTELYDNIGINNDLLNIIYFNVGQADSTLITTNGYTMLIDTGNDSDGYYIAKFLKAQNINKIDYLILTHLDEDHIGGTYKIIE